jgi:hypothetical protein
MKMILIFFHVAVKLSWSQIENFELSNTYLKEFEMKFNSILAHLISFNSQTSCKNNQFLKYREILHHANYCNRLKSLGTYDRNDIIKSVIIQTKYESSCG